MGLIPEVLLRPGSPDEKQGINNRSHGAMRGNQNDTRRIPLRYERFEMARHRCNVERHKHARIVRSNSQDFIVWRAWRYPFRCQAEVDCRFASKKATN